MLVLHKAARSLPNREPLAWWVMSEDGQKLLAFSSKFFVQCMSVVEVVHMKKRGVYDL